jgi:hypothetical protein
MRCLVPAVTLVTVLFALGGCGGGAASSGPLTPMGEACPSGPPGDDQVNTVRTDAERFKSLEALGKQLLDSEHPLSRATLVGGESNEPIGAHVRTVGSIISGWELEKSRGEPAALRREADGDLAPVANRIRAAADKLTSLGPSAKEGELVCWSLELWKTARAYTRMSNSR